MSLLDRITEEWINRGILEPIIEKPVELTAPLYTATDVIKNQKQEENTYDDTGDE
jgi:hypothetical protein